MRFGLAIVTSVSEMARAAVLAERLGFDSAWSPDETVGYQMEYGPSAIIPDVFGSLTTIAAKTKKIHVGSGVVDGLIRHPAKLAQSAATLDSASDGRFLLGIGGSEAGNHEPFGIPTDNPYGRIKETIQIARLLWKSSYKERVNYDGRFHTLKEAYLRIQPRRLRTENAFTRRRIGRWLDTVWAYAGILQESVGRPNQAGLRESRPNFA